MILEEHGYVGVPGHDSVGWLSGLLDPRLGCCHGHTVSRGIPPQVILFCIISRDKE